MPNKEIYCDNKIRIDLLNDIAIRILGNQDLAMTTETILETLKTHTGAYGGTICFLDEQKKNLHPYAWTKTSRISSALRFVEGNIFKFSFPLNSKNNLLTKCITENKMFISDKLRDFYSPIFSENVIDLIDKFLKTKVNVVLPIRINRKPYGTLFFAFTKYDHLSKEQIEILQFYTNLSSLAIDNSLKYLSLEKKYQLEKETTALLSHELKTPIAIAYNSAQMYKLLLDKNSEKLGPMFKDFEEIHEDVKSSVSRLNQICNSIFSLMEVEKTKDVTLHKLDLEHRLEQVIANFERKAKEKGLKFNSDLKCKSGIYYGGGVQLEQIITILADNAIKYTNSGLVDLSITQKNNKIVCIITDTGCGIPPNKRHAVFERFYRHKSLKNKYLYDTKGLGLGLYVAQQIVKKLDGKITVDNNPKGRGTRFTVEIPVYKKLREKTADNAASYY